MYSKDVVPRAGEPVGSGSRSSSEAPISREMDLHTSSTDPSSGRPTLELYPPCSSQLLRPRKKKYANTELVSKLVSQMLCSFPETRLDEISFPPFMHGSTFEAQSET